MKLKDKYTFKCKRKDIERAYSILGEVPNEFVEDDDSTLNAFNSCATGCTLQRHGFKPENIEIFLCEAKLCGVPYTFDDETKQNIRTFMAGAADEPFRFTFTRV